MFYSSKNLIKKIVQKLNSTTVFSINNNEMIILLKNNNVSWATNQYIRIISERYDTVDCGNDAEKWKTLILICNNILQYYWIYYIIRQKIQPWWAF